MGSRLSAFEACDGKPFAEAARSSHGQVMTDVACRRIERRASQGERILLAKVELNGADRIAEIAAAMRAG